MIYDIINIAFAIIAVLMGFILAICISRKQLKRYYQLQKDYEMIWSTNQKLAEANKNLQKYIEDNK